jgi:hypothetical protein
VSGLREVCVNSDTLYMGSSPFAECDNCYYPQTSWNETNLAGHWVHYCILQSKKSMVVPCTAVGNMSKLVMMWVCHFCVIQTALLTWQPAVCWSHISTWCTSFSQLWKKGCKIFNPMDHHSIICWMQVTSVVALFHILGYWLVYVDKQNAPLRPKKATENRKAAV